MGENAIQHQNQSPSIGKLAHALSKAQGEMSGATKDSNNLFFSSKYADLNACIEAVRGPLSKNELAVIQTTKSSGKTITIITTLAHSSGEWIRGEIDMTPAKDNDQGRGSSITYGRRYTFAAIVGLAQKDDDGNDASGNNSKDKPKAQPKQDRQPENRTVVEQWLDWIDKHIPAGASSTQLEDNWNRDLLPNLSTFPPNQQKELKISYRTTLGLLKEKESNSV